MKDRPRCPVHGCELQYEPDGYGMCWYCQKCRDKAEFRKQQNDKRKGK